MTNSEVLPVPKVSIDNNGDLAITASTTSSKNDFDFFVGKWQLRNKKLKSRLTGCTEWVEFESTQEMRKLLNGIGNIDNFLAEFDGEPFEGMSLRLFNPKTRLWSIYWSDSVTGVLDPPVVGSFENNIGYFFTKDIFNGKDIIMVFRWDTRDKEHPVWSQAYSEDKGETWEWNWYMFMSRIK
jgi:hypothetical protein